MKFAALLLTVLLGSAASSPLSSRNQTRTPTACADLRPPSIPGVKYLKTVGVERTYVLPATPSTTLHFCEVNVTLTHGRDANDTVLVSTWLPTDTNPVPWTGRFQGTGGSGYVAGVFGLRQAPAVALGYSASSTDAGVGYDLSGSWLYNNQTRSVNTALLTNFAYRSLHELTMIGKAITADYYGQPIRKAYFNGCSTGGRQGMMAAQRFPDDYDGILSEAPAINWARWTPALSTSPIQLQRLPFNGPDCELTAIRQAAVDKCDPVDGYKDGIVAALGGACVFNATSQVGKPYLCNGTDTGLTVTPEGAALVNTVYTGPSANDRRVWYGYEYDTDVLAVTGTPLIYSSIGSAWIRNAVLADPTFDIAQLDPVALARVVAESYRKYNDLIGTENVNLLPFHRRGGKVVSWHGTADQVIPFNGTIDYYTRVTAAMQSKGVEVHDFYRVFAAQGEAHCGGGVGTLPTDPLAALVSWVEQGKAPESLEAQLQQGGSNATQQLCLYPTMPIYSADGSFRCEVTEFSKSFTPLPPPK